MAVATKQKLARITTPRGVAVYPKLTTPGEYKGKSSYSTGIRITDEACAAIKLPSGREKRRCAAGRLDKALLSSLGTTSIDTLLHPTTKHSRHLARTTC